MVKKLLTAYRESTTPRILIVLGQAADALNHFDEMGRPSDTLRILHLNIGEVTAFGLRGDLLRLADEVGLRLGAFP